jgi:sec-independent protein translocase protein TatA
VFDFSPVQILIVLAIALIVLGPKRLPEMARSLGRGLRDFKGSLSGEDGAEHHEATERARHSDS